MEDDGTAPARRRRGDDRRDLDAGRDDRSLGNPADRVVAPDDLAVGLLAEAQLLRGLPADVRPEVLEDRALAERPEDRELQRLRDEREAEHEVEDVRLGEQPRELAPLPALAANEAALEVERAVCLGVERVAVEDDEARVDAA